ncbi:MAG: DUF3305 domain-containing protein [Burkholderiales bacterium]
MFEPDPTRPATAIPLVDQGPIRVAVIMERTTIHNRWQPYRWAPIGILPDDQSNAAPGRIGVDAAAEQWRHPGFAIALYRDEAEGYYLNVSSPVPCAFVKWEMVDEQAVPHSVTLSYNEAARIMDGGGQVDSVPLPAEVLGWLARFVDAHYHPEVKKKRMRPPSFKGAHRQEPQ